VASRGISVQDSFRTNAAWRAGGAMIEIQAFNYNGRPPPSELRGIFGPEGGTLGRGPDNQLTLPDPARHVSRVQASIRFDGTRYLIANVSTANPIFLNEEEIESGAERPIHPGDALRVGLYQLIVCGAKGSPQVAVVKPGSELDTVVGPPILPSGVAPGDPVRMSGAGSVVSGLGPLAVPPRGATTSTGTSGAKPPAAAPSPPPGANLPPEPPFNVAYIVPPSAPPVARMLPPQAPATEPKVRTLQPAPRTITQHPAPSPPRNPTLQPSPTSGRSASSAGQGARMADPDALLAAFLRGAGVPSLAVPNGLTPELMELMGRLVYEGTAGVMELIAARRSTKRAMGAEVTVIAQQGNNPLKFLPTPEAAIMQMLGHRMPGYMRTADAMREAFDDLRAHEAGVIAGMRAALGAVLKRFDPAVLEQRLGAGGLLDALVPNAREGRLWNLYSERFHEIFREAEDDFQVLLGQAFVEAYEEQVAQDRAKRRLG
jgi:type VI secretion system FHA domain protein